MEGVEARGHWFWKNVCRRQPDRQDCRALAVRTTIDRLSVPLLSSAAITTLGASRLAASLHHSLPRFHFRYGCYGNAHPRGDWMRLCRRCIRRPQRVGPVGKKRDWVLLVASCDPRPSFGTRHPIWSREGCGSSLSLGEQVHFGAPLTVLSQFDAVDARAFVSKKETGLANFTEKSLSWQRCQLLAWVLGNRNASGRLFDTSLGKFLWALSSLARCYAYQLLRPYQSTEPGFEHCAWLGMA